MIEWIWNNREWLFSGLGVFIIGGAIAAIYRHFKKSPPQQIVQVILPQTSVKEDKTIAQVTPAQIFDEMQKLPILQQQQFREHYKGLRVSWRGKLSYICTSRINDDHYTVIFRMPSTSGASDMYSVTFDIPQSKYPGLGLLHEGSFIDVTGSIERLDVFDVHLTDVDLSFSI
jgi:hypothetical protein